MTFKQLLLCMNTISQRRRFNFAQKASLFGIEIDISMPHKKREISKKEKIALRKARDNKLKERYHGNQK